MELDDTIPDLPSIASNGDGYATKGKERPKIIQTLRGGEWDTVCGKQRFGGAKTCALPAVPEQPI